jgi:hypothetical protein
MTDLSVAKKLAALQAQEQGAFRHRRFAVRRPRRLDQHHAAHPAVDRRRGHPPRPQPLGAGDRQRALQEDVQGIAITSYQGGHVEFFKYMIDLLKANGGENIKVFGGGGGVIVPAEIKELHEYGVTRIYSPEDGVKMGCRA